MLLKGDTLPRGNGTVRFHLDASNESFPSYVPSDTVNAVILLAGFKGQLSIVHGSEAISGEKKRDRSK